MTAHRRTARIALAATALTLVATGCSLIQETQKGERTYTVDGKVSAVSAASLGGNIRVVGGDEADGKVRVTEKYEYTERKPRTQHSLKGGRLTLEQDDCGSKEGTCNVSFEVTVPRSAAADLDTEGGDVSVRGTSGTIAARSSGGDVEVRDSAARKVKMHTDGGDVIAAFNEAPDQLEGTTSGGNVDLRLPRGDYAIDASTDGGSRKVDVPSSDKARHKVKAHSSGGNILVRSS